MNEAYSTVWSGGRGGRLEPRRDPHGPDHRELQEAVAAVARGIYIFIYVILYIYMYIYIHTYIYTYIYKLYIQKLYICNITPFTPHPSPHTLHPTEREFIIDNLLVRIHLIIKMILEDRPCAKGA